ncbi:MAG TPA: pectate lyase, partial [Erythrobacter sp.]|nr:pectate lyase [Erythrobacter sp.]
MLDLAFAVKDAINGEETVMKYIVNCLLALCVFVIASPVAVNAAEPTDGGAGGQIVRVTTLAKDGPGSLADALDREGPRIIVFEVGGAIDLERSSLTITQPHVTIAGQTAPSPGITILRGGINVNTHDVIIRHLRVAVGSDGLPKRHGWEVDAFSTRSAHNLLIENNSFFWGVDENMSASGPRFTGDTVEEWREGTSRNIVFRSNLAA